MVKSRTVASYKVPTSIIAKDLYAHVHSVNAPKTKTLRQLLVEWSAKHGCSFGALKSAYHRVADTGITKSTGNKIKKKKSTNFRILTDVEEQALRTLILVAAKHRLPVHPIDVKETVRSMKNLPADWSGSSWYRNFAKRNPDVTSKKTVKLISDARTSEQTLVATRAFIKARRELFDRMSFSPEHIINADETLLTINNKILGSERLCPGNNFGAKGSKLPAVGSAIKFVTAAGGTVLTVYILKCTPTGKVSYKLQEPEKSRSATRGHGKVMYCFNESGRMNGTLWKQVIVALCDTLEQLSPGVTQLLMCDNVSCHHNLDALMYGQSHNLEFLFLPPNSTHFLQPLDDLPFANFKKKVKKLVRDSQMCFATQKDTKNTILEIVHVAFAQTFTTKVVSDAWRRTGMYPFDEDIVLERARQNVTPNVESGQQRISKNAVKLTNILFETKTKGVGDTKAKTLEVNEVLAPNTLFTGDEVVQAGLKRQAAESAKEDAKAARKAAAEAKKAAVLKKREETAEKRRAKALADAEAKEAKAIKAKADQEAKRAAAAQKETEMLQKKCQSCGTVRRKNQEWKEEVTCRLCERFLVCGKCDGSSSKMSRHQHQCLGNPDAESKRLRKRKVMDE